MSGVALYGGFVGKEGALSQRDLSQFIQVRLNEETGTIEWPTGADFNPTLFHDWPQQQDCVIAEHEHRI